jgi:putative Mg2+ transporter-C (MgtC) family protein
MLIGCLIGLNRELYHKPTGIRTLGLVGLGSAVAVLAVAKHPDADASRVIQGVITGIGFLGAGVILHRPTGMHVENLTTAAAIWITAALGVLSALGDWPILLIGVILTFLLRPSPPRQWTSTSSLLRSIARNSFPAASHCCSNCSSGIDTSTIGRWNHSIFRRDTSSPRRSTLSRRSSSGCRSVTTATAPQLRIASRSRARSRSQYPVAAFRSYFPGQKVIPTRPNSDPAPTTAICRGWLKDVLFIHKSDQLKHHHGNDAFLRWKVRKINHLDRAIRISLPIHRARARMVLDLRPQLSPN